MSNFSNSQDKDSYPWQSSKVRLGKSGQLPFSPPSPPPQASQCRSRACKLRPISQLWPVAFLMWSVSSDWFLHFLPVTKQQKKSSILWHMEIMRNGSFSVCSIKFYWNTALFIHLQSVAAFALPWQRGVLQKPHGHTMLEILAIWLLKGKCVNSWCISLHSDACPLEEREFRAHCFIFHTW